MKKRLLSMLIAILMVVSLMPVMALTTTAAEAVASGTTGDCTWSFDNTTGILTISGEGAIGNDQSWIEHVDSITSIVIEDGVSSIVNYAFCDCSSLKSVTLPASMATIGNYAFTGCSSLESVTIPASVTAIGNAAFYGCSSLATVKYLGTSEPSMGSYVFNGCNLTTANVPVNYESETFGGLNVSKTLVDEPTPTEPEITDIIISDWNGNGVVEVDTQNKKYIVTIPVGEDETAVTVTVKGNNLDKITAENENNYLAQIEATGSVGLAAIALQPNGDMVWGTTIYPRAVGTQALRYSTDGGATWTETGWTVEVKQAIALPEITDIIISDRDGNGVVEVDAQNKKYIVTIPAGASNTVVTVTVKGNNLDKITTENENNYKVKFVNATMFTLWADYLQPSGEMQVSSTVHLHHVGTATVAYSTDGGRTYTETGWTVEVKQAVAEPEITDIIISDYNGNGAVEVDSQNKHYTITIPAGEDGTTVTVTVKGNNLDKITTENENNYRVKFYSVGAIIMDPAALQPTGDMVWSSAIYSFAVGTQALRYSTDGGATYTETGWTVEVKQATSATTPEYAIKAELDEAVANLQSLINSNTATIEQISQALAEVNAVLNNLDTTYVTHDELNQSLQSIQQTIGVIEQQMNNNIDAIAANTNALNALSTVVNDLAVTVNGLPTTAVTDALRTDLDSLSTSINDLVNRVTANENNIATLQNQVAELNKLIESGGTIEQINQALADVNTILNGLDTTYVTHDELNQSLQSIQQTIGAIEQMVNGNTDAITVNTNALNALSTVVNDLSIAINGLPTTAVTDALRADLDSLSTTLSDLVNRVTANENNITILQDQVARLNTLIENGGTIEQIQQALADINATISDLTQQISDNNYSITAGATEIELLQTAISHINENLNALDGEDGRLEDLIINLTNDLAGLTDALNALESRVSSAEIAITDLETAIANLEAAMKQGDKDLSDEISALRDALEQAKTDFAEADEELKEALLQEIEKAQVALQTAIDQVAANLEAAEKELFEAITAGNTVLDGKIKTLNTALTTAKTALAAADNANKAELTAKIEEADAALQTAIDKLQEAVDSLTAELDKAKKDLAKADADNKAALEAKDSKLQTFTIIVCIISCVALSGTVALVVWFLIDRKKRI